jgi:hypothetical protein
MTKPEQRSIDTSSKDRAGEHQRAEGDWHRLREVGLSFSDDMIVRAGPISQWLWGEWNPRRAYYLAERTNAYPFFPEGSQLAIRKSTVLAHIWAREKRGFTDQREEQLVKLAILLSNLLELVRHSKESGGFGGTNAIHLWMAMLQETSIAIDRVLHSR